MKSDVIKDHSTNTIYFDDADMVGNFETVLETGVTFAYAQKKYPNIMKIKR